MFIKPISIKSNNKIKNSEKKQLIETFHTQYAIDLSKLQSVLDTENVSRVRILASCGTPATVYKFDGEPLIIEQNKELVPTVQFLWLFPDVLPHFVTHEELVPKLISGADLMVPGLVLEKPLSPSSFGAIQKGVWCAISTKPNRAPVAVGRTAMSAYDMFMSAGRGKAVIVFHVVGDQICSLGSLLPRPLFKTNEQELLPGPILLTGTDEIRSLQNESNVQSPTVEESATTEALQAHCFKTKEDYDALLRNLFLLSIESVPDNQLPMPVNVFYANHILTQKPPNCDLDIKKTSYKKVGVFLKAMQEDGLLVLNEPKPGVLMVKSFVRDHLEVRTVQPLVETASNREATNAQWLDGYPGPPTLEEVRVLTGAAMSIFKNFGYSTGDCVPQGDLHKHLDQYIRKNRLWRTDTQNTIQLNEELMKICDPNLYIEAPESTLAKPVFLITFPQLMSTVTKQLPVCHRLRFPNDVHPPIVWRKKGTPCLHLYTSTKNGKKLTRVTNVNILGIDPDAFCKRLQLLLACSVVQVEDPQYPGTVVIQAQGTHLVALSSLLTNSYGIPKRMIQGYTEPTKRKKK